MRERCRFSALDKFVPDGHMDIVIIDKVAQNDPLDSSTQKTDQMDIKIKDMG